MRSITEHMREGVTVRDDTREKAEAIIMVETNLLPTRLTFAIKKESVIP